MALRIKTAFAFDTLHHLRFGKLSGVAEINIRFAVELARTLGRHGPLVVAAKINDTAVFVKVYAYAASEVRNDEIHVLVSAPHFLCDVSGRCSGIEHMRERAPLYIREAGHSGDVRDLVDAYGIIDVSAAACGPCKLVGKYRREIRRMIRHGASACLKQIFLDEICAALGEAERASARGDSVIVLVKQSAAFKAASDGGISEGILIRERDAAFEFGCRMLDVFIQHLLFTLKDCDFCGS